MTKYALYSQHDALDLSIKRTTCPSETAKDSAKKPPEKGCPGGESSAKETPEDEEKTDGNGSVLQHDSEEKRKLLEEYIEASGKRSNEEEKDHGIKWVNNSDMCRIRSVHRTCPNT